jgi:hypothetical protein
LRDKHELLRPVPVFGFVCVRRELPDYYSLKSLLEALVHVVSESTEGNDLVQHGWFDRLAGVVVQCDREAGDVGLLILEDLIDCC